MAHFYGKIKGARGEVTRCGTLASGMVTHAAASWAAAVRVALWRDNDGNDMVLVELVPWEGAGVRRVLYRGRVDGEPRATAERTMEALA